MMDWVGRSAVLGSCSAVFLVVAGYYWESCRVDSASSCPRDEGKQAKIGLVAESTPSNPRNRLEQEMLMSARRAAKERQREVSRRLAAETSRPVLKGFDGLQEGVAAPRLRRAEHVLLARIDRLCLVMEADLDTSNEVAVMRTAEALGVHRVFVVGKTRIRRKEGFAKRITKGSDQWLSVVHCATAGECAAKLRSTGYSLWAVMSRGAELRESLTEPPPKIALVFPREGHRLTAEMTAHCDATVSLGTVGMSSSCTLSVSAALGIQTIVRAFGHSRGGLPDREIRSLRRLWYRALTAAESADEIAAADQWADVAESNGVQPLSDVRRQPEEGTKIRIPPKVRKKIAAVDGVGTSPVSR
mmetsp:Transcript_13122/g.29148  ORF Transcript_13122/g.29148 Transcript_13122/m.29148 type:complete len:358 (+) Transcript_13122:23-1096(+)